MTLAQPSSKRIQLDRIVAAVAPVLSAHGVALADVEWTMERAGWTLRLTIEREGSTETGGGVTLEDCAEVSRDVSSLLDVEDLIDHAYHLEVSSPGLDRKLKSEADFARFVGRLARVKLARPAPDGQRLLRGELASAPAGRVAVVVDRKRIEVPFGDVAEANLVFELAPQPKGGSKKQRAHQGSAARTSSVTAGTPRTPSRARSKSQ